MFDLVKKCREFRTILSAARKYKGFFDIEYGKSLERKDFDNSNLAHNEMNCAFQIQSLKEDLARAKIELELDKDTGVHIMDNFG